jgi:hypothetical protein
MTKKFNYFYRVENLINGKFYFGVHSTNNLEDKYLGSGKRISYAIKKYGKNNFQKEILESFETFKKALDYEEFIVSEELLKDPSCYNLMKGGKGGNNGRGEEWYKQHCSEAGKNCMKDPIYREIFIKKQRENWKNISIHTGFKDKKHSEEAKKNIGKGNSLSQKGEKNSQFGTCWITNGINNMKIPKDELNLWLQENWKRGRV